MRREFQGCWERKRDLRNCSSGAFDFNLGRYGKVRND